MIRDEQQHNSGARTGGTLALALFLSAGAVACGSEGDDGSSLEAKADAGEAREPARVVFTVNYPLAYMAHRIAADAVDVRFPAPPDVDPALWSPDLETIQEFQAADLILLNGADYAGWITRVTLPESKLINTSIRFFERYLVVEEAITHSHGPEGEHSHEATASTTWLDPTLATEQARAIQKAFAERWPELTDTFASGMASLAEDLARLDEHQRRVTGALAGVPLLASHPVYQYLAQRYGLDLRSVHFEPGQFPGAAAWTELESLLAEHPARWMLWEAQPLPETVERLRRLGIGSVVYHPAANRPPTGDYLSLMQENVEALHGALGSSE